MRVSGTKSLPQRTPTSSDAALDLGNGIGGQGLGHGGDSIARGDTGAPGLLHLAEDAYALRGMCLSLEFAPLIEELVAQFSGPGQRCQDDLRVALRSAFQLFLANYREGCGATLREFLVRRLTASARKHARAVEQLHRNALERERLPQPAPGVPGDAVLREAIALVPELVAGLPERRRKALVWRYFEQRSYEDIAAALDVEVEVARALISRSLQCIRFWCGPRLDGSRA